MYYSKNIILHEAGPIESVMEGGLNISRKKLINKFIMISYVMVLMFASILAYNFSHIIKLNHLNLVLFPITLSTKSILE